MILEEALNKLLRDSINLIIGVDGYCIKAEQNAPRPSGDYAIVDTLIHVSRGWEQREYENNGDTDLTEKISGVRETTLNVRTFRTTAIDAARKIHIGLTRQSIIDLFSAAGVGLGTRSQVTELAAPLENSWQDSASLDITMNFVGTDQDIVKGIASVDIASEFQSRGLAYNSNIGVI